MFTGIIVLLFQDTNFAKLLKSEYSSEKVTIANTDNDPG